MTAPLLGRQFYDDLAPAAQRLARVPRLARLIGRLPGEALKMLVRTATAADVFWKVYNFVPAEADDTDCGILADGLKTEKARRMAWRPKDSDPSDEFRPHQIQRAQDLLGAIAFELLSKKDAAGRPAPWWNGVETNLNGFKGQVRERFTAARALVDPCGEVENVGFFDQDWQALLHMDSHGLEHLIFSTDASDNQLRWNDVTTMAFFAAYWACRWEPVEKLEQARAWIIDPWDDANDGFGEFWTFAAEMPDEAMAIDDAYDRSRYVALFTPLYDGTARDAEGLPIRSTEFIHRSWDRMQGTQARRDFLAEFPALLEQKNAVAVELDGTFEDIPAGIFQMGALDGEGGADDDERPRHPVTLSAFRMNRHAVTNAQYELFDLGHRRHRGRFDGDKQRACNDDRRPVVNVSWYDTQCFARWTGNHLPTEAQWEYSCRGGAPSYQVFHFGDTLTSRQANFDGNYPYPDREVDHDLTYLDCTTEVGSYAPNGFGLYDMHGNVWEWCEDWYAVYPPDAAPQSDPVNREAASARVLRGGSWDCLGRHCGSAYRSRDEPGERYQFYGFRLAAVPALEPGKQAQAGAGASGAEARRRSGAKPEAP